MSAHLPGWFFAAVVLLAAGCQSGGGPVAAPSPSTTPSTTSTSAPPPAPNLVMNWTGPFQTRLPNGWLVRDCEGSRTNVCVYDGETFAGDIELLADYPLEDRDLTADPKAVARKWAADMVTHFRDDRAQGCSAFTFRGDEVVTVTVGGRPGARSGFTLTDRSGRVVERVVNHYVIVDGKAAIVNTDAYVTEGGCLGPSELDPSFTPDAMKGVEPYLDALVAATPITPSGV